MDASSVKTPEAHMPIDRPAEQPAEEQTPHAEQPSGDVILLVEDNAINMRVRLLLPGSQTHPLNDRVEHICCGQTLY